MDKQPIHICWFRRDLRLHDNAALYHALKAGIPVLPLFIFDGNILDKLEDKSDRRVQFIYNCLLQLNKELKQRNSSLTVFYGTPAKVFSQLLAHYEVKAVFTNHDYEPYATRRDADIRLLLLNKGIPLHTYKDQVIFEQAEVVKDNDEPYTVFTPYSRKWKEKLNAFYLKSYPVEKYLHNLLAYSAPEIPSLNAFGFTPAETEDTTPLVQQDIIHHYHETRDIPSINGTSKLSVHLRFGTISIRKLASIARQLNETFLNELIWREFYQMILWHYPHVVNGAFKPQYNAINWRNNEGEFAAWCRGETGYPIVDAGMRQLNTTGYMHNRVRMITASFLTKHLLIDWRWGETYFASKLLDFDLAANNGGWQWSAGTGCDAAPYFRIFNPAAQTDKFDPQHTYISHWVPEYNTPSYTKPIVEHSLARERCLQTYSAALKDRK